MATTQTSVQDQDNIILESAKLEYSEDGGSTLVDLGLADNVQVVFGSTPRDVQPGNGPAPDVVKGSAAQSVTVSADMWELSATAIEALTGSLFTKGTIAGTPLVDETDVLAVDTQVAGGFKAFANQQYDESTPTAIGVADDTPNTYVLGTDYAVLKVGSLWGVQWIAGGVFDPTASITLTYTVTPSSEEYVDVGGSSSQSSVYIKITNVIPRSDVAYDVHNIWEVYKMFQQGDLTTALKNKDDTDPAARIPLTMVGELDTDRTVGQQLYRKRTVKVPH